MTPTAVCFDATGTLIETAEPVGEVYRRIACEHGVDLPAWRLDDAFRRILRAAPPRDDSGETFETRCRAEFEWWSERIRQTFQATDSTLRFADFGAFVRAVFDFYRGSEAWRVREGAREMLAALQDRGLALAIVSNFDHRLPEILEHLGLSDFFGFIAIPSRCGASKPARALYATTAAALGRPLEQLVYIGDDTHDVLEGIEKLGIRVIDVREAGDLRRIPDLLAAPATLSRRA